MKNNLLFILCISLLISSCTSDRKSEVQLDIPQITLQITNRSIDFSLEDSMLTSYYIIGTYNNGHGNTFIGYNHKTKNLDIFSQDSDSVSHIRIKKDGENAIVGNLTSFLPVSKDSIWIFDQYAFYLINHRGEIMYRMTPKVDVICNRNFAMSITDFYYMKGTLIYPIVENNRYKMRFFDTKTNRVVRDIAMTYPNSNSEGNKNFADLSVPNVSFWARKIIYNYSYDNNLFVLDRDTNKETVFKGKTSFWASTPKAFSGSKTYSDWEMYYLKNHHFYNVLYIPRKNIYARISLAGSEIIRQGYNLEDIVSQKRIYITYFNKDFQVIGESKLPLGLYENCTGWCAVDSGLLFIRNNKQKISKSKNSFSYDIVVPKIN